MCAYIHTSIFSIYEFYDMMYKLIISVLRLWCVPDYVSVFTHLYLREVSKYSYSTASQTLTLVQPCFGNIPIPSTHHILTSWIPAVSLKRKIPYIPSNWFLFRSPLTFLNRLHPYLENPLLPNWFVYWELLHFFSSYYGADCGVLNLASSARPDNTGTIVVAHFCILQLLYMLL